MSYAGYIYYSGTYCGSLIPEEKFSYYSARASEYIDKQTFDRLLSGVPQELANKVSSCCCELAENIYRFAPISPENSSSADIASEKVGQYSVSYRSGSEKISSMLGKKDAGLTDLLYSILSKHLGTTGLLYKGVD